MLLFLNNENIFLTTLRIRIRIVNLALALLFIEGCPSGSSCYLFKSHHPLKFVVSFPPTRLSAVFAPVQTDRDKSPVRRRTLEAADQFNALTFGPPCLPCVQ